MSWQVVISVAIGVATGVLSGLMGVGGGLLMVPAMVLAVGFGQHMAQGTSLVAIIPTAIAATYRHHRNGFVRFRVAGGLVVGGVLGAAIGSVSALSLEESSLRLIFAAVLALTGIRLIRGGTRAGGQGREVADDGEV